VNVNVNVNVNNINAHREGEGGGRGVEHKNHRQFKIHEVFAKFWEGGYIGVVKIFFGRVPLFGVLLHFLLTSFAIILEGGFTLIPPHPPPPRVHL
jgi:hypothetical protein